MVSFLIEMYSQPIDNSFIGWIIFIMLWILLIMLIFLVVYVIDSLTVTTTNKKGIVGSKSYYPEHTTYIYNAAAKCMTPVFHDESWELGIKVGNDFDTIFVSKSFYNKILEGDTVNVSCGRGKIFKLFYIKQVW